MASDRPLSFRIPGALIEQIDRRTTKSRADDDPKQREYDRADAVRGALNRYYELCARHLRALGLSRSELAVCCDVLNGGLLGISGVDDNASVRLTVVWAEIADMFTQRPGYGAKWDVSDEQGAALVAKLQRASYGDLVALIDFVERFWADDPDANKTINPDWQPIPTGSHARSRTPS